MAVLHAIALSWGASAAFTDSIRRPPRVDRGTCRDRPLIRPRVHDDAHFAGVIMPRRRPPQLCATCRRIIASRSLLPQFPQPTPCIRIHTHTQLGTFTSQMGIQSWTASSDKGWCSENWEFSQRCPRHSSHGRSVDAMGSWSHRTSLTGSYCRRERRWLRRCGPWARCCYNMSGVSVAGQRAPYSCRSRTAGGPSECRSAT